MNNLEIIEGLCQVCTVQATLIRDMTRALSEEAALVYAGQIRQAQAEFKHLTGEELLPHETEGSDQTG